MPAPVTLASQRLVESEPNLTLKTRRRGTDDPVELDAAQDKIRTLNLYNSPHVVANTSAFVSASSSFILSQRQSFTRLRQRLQYAAQKAIGTPSARKVSSASCNEATSHLVTHKEEAKSSFGSTKPAFIHPKPLFDVDNRQPSDQSLVESKAETLNNEWAPALSLKSAVHESRNTRRAIDYAVPAELSEAISANSSKDVSLEEVTPMNSMNHSLNCKNPDKPILVLDLDETLIHSSLIPRKQCDFWIEVVQNNDSRTREIFWVYKRPGVDQFLAEMALHYEIYVFTAGIREYASQILDRLDPTKSMIKCRLYRDECTEIKGQGSYAKDLTKISKDLKRVILVDNTPACFSLQPANGLPIKSWYSDSCDQHLNRLRDFLIAVREEGDLRPALTDWAMQ